MRAHTHRKIQLTEISWKHLTLYKSQSDQISNTHAYAYMQMYNHVFENGNNKIQKL